MSEQERPTHGGSYIRQKNGSLVRNEAPDEKEAAAPAKPKTKGK